MRPAALIANGAWAAASAPAWRRFRAALRDPAAAQRHRLLGYLRRDADTAFGREHGFASIRSVEEYQARVPIVSYDRLEPWVRRIARGETRVLTAEPVTRLVPSSGSTSAVKLVPFTRSLQREFAAGAGAWIADLYRARPSLMAGPAYWSVTPAAGASRPFLDSDDHGANVAPAVPVGFDDDAAYLGGVRAALARRVLAVPEDVRLEHDLDAFHHATLLHLLLERDLRLMSVWHPSFLAGLLDALDARWDELRAAVRRVRPSRADELARADPADIRSIWPALRLVSCWADGPAARAAAALAARLPGVALQPKGLLATEGIVTLPFGGQSPVAVTSHFYEFLGDDGRPHLAHQLEAGAEYSVVITTGGGLRRYHLADRVREDGYVEATPSVRFVGREDRVSDLAGEKLSDGFVSGVLERLFAAGPPPSFAMLAPEESAPNGRAGYVLFVDAAGPVSDDLAPRLERELRRNPHYAWCVDLGQLQPARAEGVGPGSSRAYLERCRARGQRLGDIKPASLDVKGGWRDVFTSSP
jgi:hypothetical protein